jgi:hypothetical protein
MVADPQTTIVSASALSGAACVSGSVHFNPPLSTPSEIQSVDGVTGVVLPPAQGFARVGQRNLTSLGKKHFAFAMLEDVPNFYGGGEYSLEVVFSMRRLPTAQVSSDEAHWLFSLHETATGGKELMAVGVTPTGRFAVATRENGTTLSAAGVVPVDGLFHAVRLWHFLNSGRRQLFFDNVGILDVVGPVVPEYGQPGGVGQIGEGGAYYPFGNVRMVLFNGKDGDSVLECSVASVYVNFEDYGINWPITEGAGPTITGVENDIPSRVNTALDATWWNGSPISAIPGEPTLPLTSAYNWGRETAWTARRPIQPTYRKVVSA